MPKSLSNGGQPQFPGLAIWPVLATAALLCLLGATVTAQNAPALAGTINESHRLTLVGNTHPLAQSRFDGGSASPELPLERMLLVLKRSPEREGALQQLLREQQLPGSSAYHHWLTPEQFGKQFGPAPADVQTITRWLMIHGFSVNEVSTAGNVIEFSGTHAQVRQAFHTEIHRYSVRGEVHYANASDPQIPTALAPVVAGISSLHDFRKRSMLHSFSPNASSARPDYTYTDGSHYLAPGDFWTIYNSAPAIAIGTTGSGVTIGIVGRSIISNNDVQTFRSTYLPGYSFLYSQIVNGPNPGDVSGDDVENTLDVEWAGATAPGAAVKLVVSGSTTTTDGVDLSAQYIVNKNMADVMSISYGECEMQLGAAENLFYSNLFEQAAAQGITVLVSSGDSGAAGCDSPDASNDSSHPTVAQYGLQVSGLASTPFNIAVGGSEFYHESGSWSAANNSDPLPFTSALGYIAEEVWNESCSPLNATCGAAYANLWAGSGGASNCATSDATGNCVAGWPKPSWQSGVYGLPNDGVRDIPDVSLSAAGHDGYLIQFQGSLGSVGGTSASSPAFAGIMALAVQAAGARQGLANYVLYPLAAGEYGAAGAPNTASLAACNATSLPVSGNTCVFYDVTAGSNAVPCAGGTPNCSMKTPGSYGMLIGHHATPGYDLATGLGSVNVANLLAAWNPDRPSVTPALLNFDKQTVSLASAPLTVTLQNTLDVALPITSINIAADFSETNDCGASLPAGASCTIRVVFTPYTLGVRNGTLTVHNHSPYPIAAVALSGTGVAGPIPAFSDSTVSFGEQLLGTISSARTVTLQNSGTAVLPISSITASGDFKQSNNCGVHLAAGSTCSVRLLFRPTIHSVRTGTLSLNSTALSSPLTVALDGTGTAAVISITPTSLTFGPQPLRTTSATQTITVTNTGDAPMKVYSIAASANFRQTNTCPIGQLLAAGAQCTINVTFPPLKRGAVRGSLLLRDSSLGSLQQSLLMTGTGTDFALAASPATAVMAAGNAVSSTITVSPLSGAYDSPVALSCSGLPAGTVCSFDPAVVTPGSSAASSTLTITTTPHDAGGTPAGTRQIMIIGSANGYRHYVYMRLTVR